MKNIKRKVQEGFTLIELMIVIAIVAILVALAVPAYLDYSVRAKVGECIAGAAAPKINVEEFFQSEGRLPTDDAEAGTDNWIATNYCLTIGWDGAIMTLTTQNTGGSDPVMLLTPAVSAGNKITGWNCTLSSGENRHVPATCRDTT